MVRSPRHEDRSTIDQAINRQEKLLLLLSEYALKSVWIEDEVEAALEYERHEPREMLFPVRLDDKCNANVTIMGSKAPPTPTQKPTPKPNPCPNAVGGNPWCYDFTPGNLISSPNANFCAYFSCIQSFWSGTGYVEECQDATYAKSGGRSGSCSHHGGNLRPLYSH